ncbi:MAG: hypothetical protein ACKOQ7_00670 [Actinomycetota bacterium]
MATGPDSEPQRSDSGALDLDRIERDLADAETALARLDAGTYFSDEVTGQPLTAEVLAATPLARRNRP